MLLRSRKEFAGVAAVLLVLLSGCGQPAEVTSTSTPGSASHAGILEVRVTDRPAANITGIVVTADRVEVNRTADESAAGWVTIVEGEESFDLLAVAGIEEALGEAEIEPGTYNQIRMHVVSVVVTLDGKEADAEVPSDVIRVVRPIVVEARNTAIATFDFDAEGSVVVTGSGKVIFKPVVRLLVRKGSEPFRPSGAAPAAEAAPTPFAPPDEPVPAQPSEPSTPTPEGEAAPTVPEPLVTPSPAPVEPFFLDIDSPAQAESIVDTDLIVVSGRTQVDAAVSVDDTFVEVDADGRFETTVQLVEGINLIEVVASIATGEQLDRVLTVIYIP